MRPRITNRIWRAVLAALLIGFAVGVGGCNSGDGGDNATGVSGSAK